VSPQGEPSVSGTEVRVGEKEEHAGWWADRLVILRPEAADRDWGLLHVVPAQEEDRANQLLADLLTNLRSDR
jgi:hypothetical protein